jgi:hypothetical protein
MNVKPHQVWEFRPNHRMAWRAIRIVNVSPEAVEVQFLHIPSDAPESVRTFKTATGEMSDKSRYRFVSDRP